MAFFSRELIASLIKYPDFSFEKEKRLILLHHPIFNISYNEKDNDVITSENKEDINLVQFRTKNNSMIRFVEIVVPKEYFKSIKFGYLASLESMRVFQEYLYSLGYANFTVDFTSMKSIIDNYS